MQGSQKTPAFHHEQEPDRILLLCTLDTHSLPITADSSTQRMYEIFEHTADFGIRARAGSLDELFVDAARGLFSIMVANLDAVQPVEQVPIRLEADDIEGLLHGWLGELLYTFSARRLALVKFDVRIHGEPPIFAGLSATAWGEPIDLTRHEIDVEVKAITWHALKVEQQPDGWMAEVIVDV